MTKLLVMCFLIIAVLSGDMVRGDSSSLQLSDIVEKANIIDKAKEIFDSIKESDFVKTAKSISKWGLPLLDAIGSFAKIIMAEFQSDSKELAFMKDQFKILNDKMDYVDQQFEEVKRLMDWNVIKIQYSKYERSIDVLQNLILIITESPPSLKHVSINKFLLSYDQLYDNAAETLFNGFENQKKVFSENLIVAIRKYTKDHRYQIEKFFMGNLQMIIKCLEVETFYMNFKNFTNFDKFWQSTWNDRLNSLTNMMQSVAEKITENWDQQSAADINEYNVENNQLSHEAYANGLYKLLNDKFRNRLWLVLVYDPLDSGTDHALYACNGITQMQLRGHNVAVSSLALDSGPLDSRFYSTICSWLPNNIGSWGHGPAHYVLIKYVQLRLNCKKNQMAAVIRSKSVKVFLAPEANKATCRWSGYYNRFVDIHKTLDIIVMG